MNQRVVELTAIIKGRVQGVGFRWTVVDCAEALNLNGTVQNLEDGSVCIVAQGGKDQIEMLLERIEKESASASIASISKKYQKVNKPLTGFKIIH